MAAFSQNDITLLYVGKADLALTTGGIDSLGDGEIGVFTPSGTRLVEATSGLNTDFILVQGRGSESPIVSPVLNSSMLKKATATTHAAAVEKEEFIGYNGTSGAIDTINDNIYYVRLNIDQSLTSNHGHVYVKHGVFQSDTSASQVEVADGITSSILANFSREAEKQIKVERVTDSTATANPGAITIAVKNGNKSAELSGVFAVATTIGNHVLLDGVAYKVVAVSGNFVTFDTAYQGATGTVAAVDFEAITAANAALGDWGIKLTGLPLDFKVGKIKYRKSNWVTGLEGFGTTPLTQTAGMNPGIGTAEQAKELEWFLRGNNGEFFRMGEPNIFDRINDVTAIPYSFVEFAMEETTGTMTQIKFKKNFMLLLPNAKPAYFSTNPNGLQRTLEVLLFGAVSGNLDY